MGRDARNTSSRYRIRCKVYTTKTTENDEIVRLTNSEPIVFYARVIQDYKESHFFVDNYNTTLGNVVIETRDLKQNDIKRLDTVEYLGKLYNVENMVVKPEERQKQAIKRAICDYGMYYLTNGDLYRESGYSLENGSNVSQSELENMRFPNYIK